MTLLLFQDHYTVRKNRLQLSYGRRAIRFHQYQDSKQNGEEMGNSMTWNGWKGWSLTKKKTFLNMHFIDTQSSTGSRGFYLLDNLGPHVAPPSPLPSSVTHRSFCLSPCPTIPSSPLYTNIFLKWKYDSVISLLKVIQWLFMTCRISDYHVAKQTYKDLGDAVSFVSCTISSLPFLLLPRCWLAVPWKHCS